LAAVVAYVGELGYHTPGYKLIGFLFQAPTVSVVVGLWNARRLFTQPILSRDEELVSV
jgi:hypothetical protein